MSAATGVQGRDAAPPRRSRPARRLENRAGLLFAAPWLVSLALLTIGPLLATIVIGFTDFSVGSAPRWTGFANYERMWADHAFWTSARNSALFAGVLVPVKLAVALGLALLLSRPGPMAGFYRTVVYLPVLVPVVAGSILFTLLLAPGAGPVNVLLQAVGVAPPDWLQDPQAAFWALLLISLWPLGVETLVFLGGLQAIPPDVLQAARLDSPRPWHGFIWITLPLLTPMILFNLVIGIITSFQVFTQALVIGGTTGQPAESTLMYMVVIYRSAFRYFDMGYAAALSTVLFLAVSIVTVLIFRSSRSWVHYEGDAP